MALAFFGVKKEHSVTQTKKNKRVMCVSAFFVAMEEYPLVASIGTHHLR
jgi:hypothetical protein